MGPREEVLESWQRSSVKGVNCRGRAGKDNRKFIYLFNTLYAYSATTPYPLRLRCGLEGYYRYHTQDTFCSMTRPLLCYLELTASIQRDDFVFLRDFEREWEAV